MPLTVAIVERHPALASALRKVVLFAQCVPVMLSCSDELRTLAERPTAVIVRVTTTMPADLPGERLRDLAGGSWVLALTTTYADLVEARRLRCDIVLQPSQQDQALYEALRHVVEQETAPPAAAAADDDVGPFFLFA
jgi:DNA-binding NarL/FixJ family response regulator